MGIRFGINSALVFQFTYMIGRADAVIYVIYKLIIIISILIYSYVMSVCSLDIKRFDAIGRFKVKNKCFINMLLSVLVMIGFLVIVNGTFSLIIYF